MWDYRLPDSIPNRQKSTAKLVLLKLGDNANDEGYCWPSIDRIAHECDMSYRSVTRVLSLLESEQILKRVARSNDGKKTSNGYWINIKKLESEADPYKQPANKETDNPFLDRSPSPIDGSSRPIEQDSMTYKPSVNHQRTINTDTDISLKRNAYFINELLPEDFPNCIEAMRIICQARKSGFAVYDGSLRIDEWSDCEDAMSSCDGFYHVGYFDWWIRKYGNTFTKKPSLTNMVCDMNGIPFDQFYDSTYLQECE